MLIPITWVNAYNDVKELGYKTFMAGGCLRDLDNGRPVKDIDIFITVETVVDVTQAMHDLNVKWQCAPALDAFRPSSSDGGASYIHDVSVYHPGIEVPINLIGSTSDNPMDEFDFGICQISYCDGVITCTEAYKKDKQDHTFTLINKHNPVKSRARYTDFKNGKYSGWTYIGPTTDYDNVKIGEYVNIIDVPGNRFNQIWVDDFLWGDNEARRPFRPFRLR